MNNKLGKLVKVDLREIWKNEEYDFSKWLAEEESLALLSDEIGIAIRLPEKEALVGKYSVDILAEEEGTGRKVVIENQLEKTNHDHLGKIITYAAGHDASIVIWIFKDITEEHRSAIDWLNQNTGEDRLFFAIKIEGWRIDGSAPAPKFRAVSTNILHFVARVVVLTCPDCLTAPTSPFLWAMLSGGDPTADDQSYDHRPFSATLRPPATRARSTHRGPDHRHCSVSHHRTGKGNHGAMLVEGRPAGNRQMAPLQVPDFAL